MQVPVVEQSVGIEVFATDSRGIGGSIRESIEDFVVEEVLVDGSTATIDSSQGIGRVLGSSSTENDYLLCKLIKRNWDTFAVLKQIAKQLNIDIERIQIAGIKDAKAVTAQHITIEGVSEEDIGRISVKDTEITALGYVHRALSPYFSHGNKFRITINGVELSRGTVEERLSETTRQLQNAAGVANFFGHQRFGTTRPITHLVGKTIVNGDFEQAAMLFLAKTFPHEHPDSKRARMNLESTHNFNSAVDEFPKQLRYERSMLRHLVDEPGDYVGAFRTLPFRLRELFVQAYQSYLFNKVLSRRLAEGMSLRSAEIGDYAVKTDRHGLTLKGTATKARQETIKEINEHIVGNRMRLCIPLFGSRQHFSGGQQGQIERRILEDERIAAWNFRIKSMPEISSRGGLRIMQTPLTDLAIHISKLSETEKLGINVGFSLQRGSYATVVLRELMKPSDPQEAGF
jgi:tRNA pseudouridine13 synthase